MMTQVLYALFIIGFTFIIYAMIGIAVLYIAFYLSNDEKHKNE